MADSYDLPTQVAIINETCLFMDLFISRKLIVYDLSTPGVSKEVQLPNPTAYDNNPGWMSLVDGSTVYVFTSVP